MGVDREIDELSPAKTNGLGNRCKLFAMRQLSITGRDVVGKRRECETYKILAASRKYLQKEFVWKFVDVSHRYTFYVEEEGV